MEPLIFVGVTMVLGGIAVALTVNHARKLRQNWAVFAAGNGLAFSGQALMEQPSISGRYGGFFINIYTESRGGGKNRTTWTLFCVPMTLPEDLNLYSETVFSGIGKMLGMQDLRLGDDTLDGMFVVQARDVVGAKTLLTHPRVRAALREVGSAHPGLRLNGGRVIIEVRGYVSDMVRMQKCMLAAVHVAAAINEAQGQGVAPPVVAPAAMRMPVEARPTRPPGEGPGVFGGTLALGAGAIHPAGRPAPPVPATQLPPVRPLAAAPRPFDPAPEKPAPTRPLSKPVIEPLAQPSPVAPPPQAGLEPLPDLAKALKRLASPGLTLDERQKAVAVLKGAPCRFTAEVERVDWTSDISLPDHLRSGRTVIGRLEGAAVAVRYPEARNAEIDALARGARLEVRGIVADWDDFFSRLSINAS